jgi:hypothetical protein
LYIVSQKKAFLYNAELKIYAITEIISEDLHADKEKRTRKSNKQIKTNTNKETFIQIESIRTKNEQSVC